MKEHLSKQWEAVAPVEPGYYWFDGYILNKHTKEVVIVLDIEPIEIYEAAGQLKVNLLGEIDSFLLGNFIGRWRGPMRKPKKNLT